MPLTLVLGPANSAKAGEVLGAYAAAAQRGALLVVPTASDADHYARELAGHRALIGSVATFAGLAAEIALRAGYLARPLRPLQREWVLRRVVAGASLERLRESAAAPGFATAAGELIAEQLQRSLITPQRFAGALKAWAAGDERRGPYAREVAALYLGYARELERIDRVDPELFTWRALDALRAAPGRWGSDPVFLYGFDELTPLERDAVETLSRVAGAEVTVSLTYEPGRAALAARASGVQELRALADRVLELPALDEHYAPAGRVALHHLERNLFEPAPAAPVDPGRAVRLLEAGGERAEAELIAAEVLELLHAGVDAGEIVVVSRAPAAAAASLRPVFEEYGLELAGERPVAFAHTSLGRGVTALARCALLAEPEATAGDLLDYLRTPGVAELPELVDGLEAEIRQQVLLSATAARRRLGWSLEEIDGLRAAADPAAELVRQARRLLAGAHRGEARVLDAREELDGQALRALAGAVGELEELGERPRGRELVELVEQLPVSVTARPTTSAVLLADPLSIRARRFRAVFVCGLQESEFPLAGAPEPFLSDDRRRELALSSGLVLARSEDVLTRERYLFYACVSRASEQLVLAYRSSDEDGNLALPSPFIADVADLLADGWRERRRRRLLADVVWPLEEAPTPRERARAAARAAAGPPPLEPELRILGPVARHRLRHLRILSAGALESYADCPVKWLVERQLSPAELAPEPEAIVRGNLIHAALEQLLRALGESVTPVTLTQANRILDEILAELPRTMIDERGGTLAPGRSEAVRAAALRSIEADLRRYLAAEAADGCGWRPEGVELRFGFDEDPGSLPPLVLGDGEDRISLRGVIDRVDVAPDGSGRAIVRDYKSGSVRPEYRAGRWAGDRELQVALYMVAVRELLALDPVAGFYQPFGGRQVNPRGIFLEDAPVDARVVRNDGRDREALEAELADGVARALALARRLRGGELEPLVATCSSDGCLFPGICWSQR